MQFLVNTFRQHIFWILLVIVFVVWATLRFYKLDQTEFFYNDSGRDYLTVWHLVKNYDIPLLGPGASGIATHQSAFFFYLLTPVLWLTNFHAFGSHLTLLIFTWTIILLAAYFVRLHKDKWLVFFSMLGLYTISPIIIAVERVHIWNPHFAWQGLFLAFFLLLCPPLSPKLNKLTPLFNGIALAFSNAMSFIVFPAAIVFSLPYFFGSHKWKRMLTYCLGFFGGSLFFFLPMVAFEIRYKLQMTKQIILFLFGGETVRLNSESGQLGLLTKLRDLGSNFFPEPYLIYIFIVGFVVVGLYIYYKKQHRVNNLFYFSIAGLLITLSLSMLYPVQIHSHYTVAFCFFFFSTLATLPGKTKYICLAVITFYYLLPIFNGQYFSNPSRLYSFSELSNCAQEVCNQVGKEKPLFVSLVSSYYAHHVGPEFQFALLKAGCKIKDIAIQTSEANTMVVFGSGSKFTFGESSYYELTLLGESELINEGICQDNLRWTILEKI